MVVNAARAVGIQPIDSVFSDVDDMEALARNVSESKALGFTGMGCIHPRQVPVINKNFLPGDAEIQKAQKIVLAFEKAEREGMGVVAVESKMIDPPVVKRSLRIILIIRNQMIVYTNPSFEVFSNYSRKDLMGKDPISLIHPDDHEEFPEFLSSCRNPVSASRQVRGRYPINQRDLVLYHPVLARILQGEIPAVFINLVDIPGQEGLIRFSRIPKGSVALSAPLPMRIAHTPPADHGIYQPADPGS